MNMVILGRPGAGKGMQSRTLARRLGLARVSLGDLFRLGVEAGRREFDAYVSGARLASDEIAGALLRQHLGGQPSARGFVLDGFPRRVSQAHMLTELFPREGIGHAVYIDVSPATAMRRLLDRTACPSCAATYPEGEAPEGSACGTCEAPVRRRVDDEPARIERRMGEFETEIDSLVEFYRDRRLLRHVDGDGSPGTVLDRIASACLV